MSWSTLFVKGSIEVCRQPIAGVDKNYKNFCSHEINIGDTNIANNIEDNQWNEKDGKFLSGKKLSYPECDGHSTFPRRVAHSSTHILINEIHLYY